MEGLWKAQWVAHTANAIENQALPGDDSEHAIGRVTSSSAVSRPWFAVSRRSHRLSVHARAIGLHQREMSFSTIGFPNGISTISTMTS